jgi:hypothetical protein
MSGKTAAAKMVLLLSVGPDAEVSEVSGSGP